MADHMAPDYTLEETLTLGTPEQFRALFEDTRRQIVHLLLERAATISELAESLNMPKGTIGHHVGVLETAGLIHVVRTKKVRAIEAKYYGRTARTYILTSKIESDLAISPDFFLTTAAEEFAQASESFSDNEESPIMSTLRYARIPDERAAEWLLRLGELTQEFASDPRGGDTTYGMLAAFYPTDRPHLPDEVR
ncbi:MAG: ArsR/SmtB family transcription factor [Acidimicrobiia bacterium]